MADPIYITMNDLYSIVRSTADVHIVYRPIPGVGDATTIMPGLTGMRIKLGEKSIIVVYGLEYANTIFEHNDCIDFIVPLKTEEVTTNSEMDQYQDAGDKSCLREDYKQILRLRGMDCSLYMLQHPCPCGHHEKNTDPMLRRSRQEIFSEACGVEFDIDNYNFVLHDEDLEAKKKLELPDRYVVIGMKTSTWWKDYRYTERLVWRLKRLGRKFDFHVVTMDEHIRYPLKGVYGLIEQKLTDLYGVIAQSLMTISLDSAYAHVAGALEVPVFGIYGPTPPEKFLRYKKVCWLSRFDRCDRQYCWYKPCKLRRCLSVHPNQVIREIKTNMLEFGLI